MEDVLEPTADPAWVLEAVGYDPLRESSLGTRFAISNGFLGVRGERALTRGERWVVPARTYVAGLFDTPDNRGAVPRLVPAANWLQVRVLLPGGPFVRHPGDVASHRMVLDEKRGALLTEFRQLRAPDIRLRIRTLRLVSLAERAIGLQLIQCEIEEGEVEITFEASFEGLNLGLASERLDQDIGVWRTQHSGKQLAMATVSSLQIDGEELPPNSIGPLKRSWTWKSRPAQSLCFERMVAVTRSDRQGADTGDRAWQKLGVARQLGWRSVFAAHQVAWAGRWRSSDIEIDGDAPAQQALRFAIYHLNSAANPDDDHVSIAARALTGDDYSGHVFWDTEIFLLPFYILTWPKAARALLLYRFHTLDAARAKAAGMGWRGALYAWESADTGEEATPAQLIAPDRQVVDVLCGQREQHISADVAYAVWQYWLATVDADFLLDAGAEIILETGRFWSSRAQPEADGLCHIRGVIGPDEYHTGIDDNAFTNVMARWNIRRALEVVALLRERWPVRWASLSVRLGLDDAELARWQHVADTMATGLNPATGVFEQFAGFGELEEINLEHYAGRSVPMDVVLGRDRIQRCQVVKQADVVALLALLPHEFAGDAGAANFQHYEPRCSHGSSLSAPMHGRVAARLGFSETALRYFRKTAATDLADSHVAIDGGVHIGALGGLWQTAVLGFAGLSLQPEGVALHPQLPPGWRSLCFPVQWRGRNLRVLIVPSDQRVEVTLETGEPMQLVVNGEPHDLGRDRTLRVKTSGRSAG